MKISVLIPTRNRPGSLAQCVRSAKAQTRPPHEILVLDDGSDEGVVTGALAGHPDVRVLRADVPCGASTARNRLLAAATGDLFLFFDDDAFLVHEDGLERLAIAMEQHPGTGVFAMRLIERVGDRDVQLLPFSVHSLRKVHGLADRPTLISYFLGGGHAIRREVFQSVGGYDESFIWGEEELDLSYRVVNAGYELLYVPDVVVRHQPMPSVLRVGERRDSELYLHTRNRILLARKHLPARYVVPYLAIWMSRWAGIAIRRGLLGEFIGGVIGAVRMLRQTPRAPLRPAAVSYLKQHYGRLWY